MPLVIKFRNVEWAITVLLALNHDLGDIAAEQMRVEYEEQGVFNCEADGGDKFVRVRVERVGDVALTTISGKSLDVIERFCQRTGAEYVVE